MKRNQYRNLFQWLRFLYCMQVNHSVKEGCCQNEIIHPKVKHSGKRIWGWFAPSRQLKSILQDNIRVTSPLAEAVVEIGDAAEKKRTLNIKVNTLWKERDAEFAHWPDRAQTLRLEMLRSSSQLFTQEILTMWPRYRSSVKQNCLKYLLRALQAWCEATEHTYLRLLLQKDVPPVIKSKC